METVIEVQIHGNNDVVLCDTYNKEKKKQSSAASALEKNKTRESDVREEVSFFFIR